MSIPDIMRKNPHLLLVNLPMQTQIQLRAENYDEAHKWLKELLEGQLQCKQGDTFMVLTSVPGTAYCIISENEFQRRVGQAQLMMGQQPGRGH